MDKEYDTQVCVAVKNDPYGFVDILNQEAEKSSDAGLQSLLREAACVIANLLGKQGGKIE